MNDLVVSSLEPWDGVWRRNQHLVSRLLAADPGLRVVFVEPPVDPLHDLRRGARPRRGQGLRPGDLPGPEGRRLWLFGPTKWLPRRVDPGADRRLTSAVLRATRRVGLRDPVLWLNDPASADLLRHTGWPSLYDITDDWLAAERPARDHARLVEDEAYLLARCHQVVVCSPRLLETKRAPHLTLIPNAVDADAYQGDLPRPGDLPTGRAIVYVGTLHRDRLDVGLCATLARALPSDTKLILVGPVALDASDESTLRRAGVLLLGPREHTAVPAYLTNADVLVVPHVVTEFTDSLDPIKVYEYLAARRPVVSTPVAGFRELAGNGAVVASDAAFTDAALAALTDPGPVAAQDVPTWAERAAAMARVLTDVRGAAN